MKKLVLALAILVALSTSVMAQTIISDEKDPVTSLRKVVKVTRQLTNEEGVWIQNSYYYIPGAFVPVRIPEAEKIFIISGSEYELFVEKLEDGKIDLES